MIVASTAALQKAALAAFFSRARAARVAAARSSVFAVTCENFAAAVFAAMLQLLLLA